LSGEAGDGFIAELHVSHMITTKILPKSRRLGAPLEMDTSLGSFGLVTDDMRQRGFCNFAREIGTLPAQRKLERKP
jgi:hypothetical protein